MRILRASDYRRMPWKNGGGETREVIVAPPAATLETLDWRISLATMTSDGPFSAFEGVERTLCVIRGTGLRLQVGNSPASVLTVKSAPETFRGDVPTYASLVDGTIVDLNVMSRTGCFQHRVRRQRLTGTTLLTSAAEVLVVFCQSGTMSVRTTSDSGELGPEDCVILDGPMEPLQLFTAHTAEICVIEIHGAPANIP